MHYTCTCGICKGHCAVLSARHWVAQPAMRSPEVLDSPAVLTYRDSAVVHLCLQQLQCMPHGKRDFSDPLPRKDQTVLARVLEFAVAHNHRIKAILLQPLHARMVYQTLAQHTDLLSFASWQHKLVRRTSKFVHGLASCIST